jgi:hypothetical protein
MVFRGEIAAEAVSGEVPARAATNINATCVKRIAVKS